MRTHIRNTKDNMESSKMKGPGSNASASKVLGIVLLFWSCIALSKQEYGPANDRLEETRLVYGVPGTIYFFPWSCWVVYIPDSHAPVPDFDTNLGMCSILTTKHVFFGISNLDFLDIAYQHIGIYLGRDTPLDPTGNQTRTKYNITVPPVQYYGLSQITISLTAHIDKVKPGTGFSEFAIANDWKNNSIQQDVIGKALNIGLLEIGGVIQWTPFVRPMPLPYTSINKIHEETRKMISFLDLHPHSRAPCSIATIGPKRSTVFTQVSYVPREICKSVYCSVDLGYCFRFPFQWFHVCFRSVVFTDPCMYDQGAALYCHWWNQSIFAILSQTENCGIGGTPAVYTVMSAPLKLWAAVEGNFDDMALVKSAYGRDEDFSKYTLGPSVPTPTINDYHYP